MHHSTCPCGTPISSKRARKYCSPKCAKRAERQRYRAKLVPTMCAHCGATFMGRRWDRDRDHQRRYCSLTCDAEAKTERYSGPVDAAAEQRRAQRWAKRLKDEQRAKLEQPFTSDPCAYCNTPAPIGIDHIVPIAAGGQDEPDNWTACCHRCNGQKGTLPLLGYLLWQQLHPFKEQLDRVHALRA